MPGTVLSSEDTRNKNPALLDLLAVTIKQMLRCGACCWETKPEKRDREWGGEVAAFSGLAQDDLMARWALRNDLEEVKEWAVWWRVGEHLGRGVTRAWSINRSEERISSWSVVGWGQRGKRNIGGRSHGSYRPLGGLWIFHGREWNTTEGF